MLRNDEISVFVLDSSGENFIKKGTYPGWVFRKNRLRSTEKGIYFRNSFDVRIETRLLDGIQVGDLVFFGELLEEEFSAAKCCRVATVSKNSFGSVPHWHIQAEYEYR